MLNSNIILCVTGSISAYKACEFASSLVKLGANVKVVFSKSAHHFVGMATFEGLTHNRVHQNLFDSNERMAHIELARWADHFIIYPASANTINKLAHGLSDELIGSLYLALEDRVKKWIAPAMNTLMLNHPTTQRSLNLLQSDGVQVLPTESDTLACGEQGFGKLLSPEKTLKILMPYKESAKKVLITGGGTSEPIDGVRSITNFSTGNTATSIANDLYQNGVQCTLLLSETSNTEVNANIKTLRFTNFTSLQQLLKLELKNHYDFVIHAAAVSDYSVKAIEIDNETLPVHENSKLSSELEEMKLVLKRNPKLIKSIKNFSPNSQLKIIGFKMTNQASAEVINKKVKTLLSCGDNIGNSISANF